MVVTVQFETDAGFVHLILKDGGLVLSEQLRPTDGGTEYFLAENVATAPEGAFQRYTFVVDYAKKFYSLKHGTTVTQKDLVLSQQPMSRLFVGTVFSSSDSNPHWIDDVVVLTSP
jgi:hypothetical protein